MHVKCVYVCGVLYVYACMCVYVVCMHVVCACTHVCSLPSLPAWLRAKGQGVGFSGPAGVAGDSSAPSWPPGPLQGFEVQHPGQLALLNLDQWSGCIRPPHWDAGAGRTFPW